MFTEQEVLDLWGLERRILARAATPAGNGRWIYSYFVLPKVVEQPPKKKAKAGGRKSFTAVASLSGAALIRPGFWIKTPVNVVSKLADTVLSTSEDADMDQGEGEEDKEEDEEESEDGDEQGTTKITMSEENAFMMAALFGPGVYRLDAGKMGVISMLQLIEMEGTEGLLAARLNIAVLGSEVGSEIPRQLAVTTGGEPNELRRVHEAAQEDFPILGKAMIYFLDEDRDPEIWWLNKVKDTSAKWLPQHQLNMRDTFLHGLQAVHLIGARCSSGEIPNEPQPVIQSKLTLTKPKGKSKKAPASLGTVYVSFLNTVGDVKFKRYAQKLLDRFLQGKGDVESDWSDDSLSSEEEKGPLDDFAK